MTLQLTETQNLGQSSLRVSPLAYGLWRFAGTDVQNLRRR